MAVGGELKSVLQPAYRDFLITAGKLRWSFDDPVGRVRLRMAAEALLDELRTARATQAAWRDLRNAVETGGRPSLETEHLRACQLRELIEERGREWSGVESRLRESALYGRFDECHALVAEEAPRTATVAWFAFMNAELPWHYLRVGQVQFFSNRLWPEAVVSETTPLIEVSGFERPSELDEYALRTWVNAT